MGGKRMPERLNEKNLHSSHSAAVEGGFGGILPA